MSGPLAGNRGRRSAVVDRDDISASFLAFPSGRPVSDSPPPHSPRPSASHVRCNKFNDRTAFVTRFGSCEGFDVRVIRGEQLGS